MRKALLVLTLVAASFAGGAVVNGPGLAWLRSMVGLTALRISDESMTTDPTPSTQNERASALDRDPAAPVSKPDPTPGPPAGILKPLSKALASVPPASPVQPATRTEIGASASDSTPPPLQPPASARQAVEKEAPAPDVISETPAPPLAAPTTSSPRDPALALATDPPTRLGLNQVVSSAGSTPAASATWEELGRKLKEQGVSRFWIEGEPGGPVRFRCIVPLVGRATVSQQFEFEAADVLAAADLAVRRITLWKATETP